MKKIILMLVLLSVSSHVFAMDRVRVGDYLQHGLPAFAFLTTFAVDDKEGRIQFYKSAGTTFVFTHGLKRSINRERPNGNNHSFPSGHTSSAFLGPAFIHQRYGLTYASPLYAAASFVGYTRVYSDHHYKSDVFAGAAIAIASSWYFTSRWEGPQVTPVIDEDQVGLMFHAQF